MSTIEDFENAPVGATATHDKGSRAMKVIDGDRGWIIRTGNCYSGEEMDRWGFTLDRPVPTTAREAIDLAWELAHEVKEGQVIPKGARYLERYPSGIEEHTAQIDIKIIPALAPLVRTVDPLPDTDPEPDWLDAPAVIATTRWCDTELWLPETGGYHWECTHCDDVRYWRDLTDVTPLYPKEVQEA